MMEIVKRHAFLFGLAVAVVVLSGATLGLTYWLYVMPNASTKSTLAQAKSAAGNLKSSPLYSDKAVTVMGDLVEQRKKQYDDLLDYIRKLGAGRTPLVKDLFPASTDPSLRHAFKGKYDEALDAFMKKLGAVYPKVAAPPGGQKATEADMDFRMQEFRKARMFANPQTSFTRPDWVDKPEAPSMAMVREGQENIWLMADLVDVLAAMNADILKAKKADPKNANAEPAVKDVIAFAPVKELSDIRIGSDVAVLSGTKMAAIPGRYRPASGAGGAGQRAVSGRAPTISGRYSKTGFYHVLPWHLSVVVEAEYAGDLIRRLKGHETFLSVEGWRERPLTEASLTKSRDVMASSRRDYGTAGVVRLEVVGESMAFELDGGRVTVVGKPGAPKAPVAAPAKGAPPAKGAGAAKTQK